MTASPPRLVRHAFRNRRTVYDHLVSTPVRNMRDRWYRSGPRERVKMIRQFLMQLGVAVATRQLYKYVSMTPENAFRALRSDFSSAYSRARSFGGTVTGYMTPVGTSSVPQGLGVEYAPPPPMPEVHYFEQAPIKRSIWDMMHESTQLETHRSQMPNRKRQKQLALPSTVPMGRATFKGKPTAYSTGRYAINYMYQGPSKKKRKRRKKRPAWKKAYKSY